MVPLTQNFGYSAGVSFLWPVPNYGAISQEKNGVLRITCFVNDEKYPKFCSISTRMVHMYIGCRTQLRLPSFSFFFDPHIAAS